ncbi:hypothetical protein [Corynebacterium xerosis]|uniref:hypothetical protein n=1 Tax=Corynebacterium xerosis TaxID=1725 RepID=UPI0036716355
MTADNFRVRYTVEAAEDLEKAFKKWPQKRKKVRKAVSQLKEYGPEYRSLQTHRMKGLKAGKDPIYISYVENHTPGAWRIHWSWCGSDIVIIYIGPHT